jgi:hypothetical protein
MARTATAPARLARTATALARSARTASDEYSAIAAAPAQRRRDRQIP